MIVSDSKETTHEGDVFIQGEGKKMTGTESDLKIRYFVTALICSCFLFLGISDSVIGPTLLDLQDLYNTSLNTITLIVLLRSLGSIIGCFLAGYLLDRFSHRRCYFLFVYCLSSGLSTALTPHAANVYVLFSLSVVYGLNSGSSDAGGNVLCMDVWRGLDSGPFMHSIHFFFGVGAFLAPIFAEPFLKEKPLEQASNETESANGSALFGNVIDYNDDGIGILYPLIGCATALFSLGYLYLAIVDPKVIRAIEKKDDSKKEKSQEESALAHDKKEKILTLILVAIMCLFFLLYVGMEVSYGLYIATFSVKSSLNLSKSDGAYITAIFWGTFAAMRFLAIFAAIKLRPIWIMTMSFAFCLFGAIPLCIWGESSDIVLKVCSAFMGIGMASVFASGYLWAEQFIAITNRISAAFVISSSLGADIFPLLLGQTIASFPMLIMYVQLAIVISCIGLFIATDLVGNNLLKLKKSKIQTIENQNFVLT